MTVLFLIIFLVSLDFVCCVNSFKVDLLVRSMFIYRCNFNSRTRQEGPINQCMGGANMNYDKVKGCQK